MATDDTLCTGPARTESDAVAHQGEDALESVTCCDGCGGGAFAAVFTSKGWSLVRCEGCGLVQTSPRRTPEAMVAFYAGAYYEQATGYAASQQRGPRRDDRLLARRLAAWAERDALAPPRWSLDVGCGHGRVVAAMQEAGWRAVGIEPSARACRAGQQAGLDLRVGTLDTARLDDVAGRVAAITALHVLEHVHAPSRFVETCATLLRPGGLLVIEVPDFGSAVARKMGPRWANLYPGLHLYQFTRATLRPLLNQSGFTILRSERRGGRGFFRERGDGRHERRAGHEVSAGAGAANTPGLRDRLVRRAFDARRHAYRVTGVRAAVRYLLWTVLGQGEALRVYARAAR